MEVSKLEKLMLLGYNVQIECKGKGRVYEMTYEATATKVNPDPLEFFKTYHSVGNSLEEVTEKLYDEVMKKYLSGGY